MSYRIICGYCDEVILFSDPSQRPQSCPNCNSFISDLVPEPVPGTRPQETVSVPPDELILIYQNTGEEIHVPAAERVLLGRQYHGKEVLEKIPQISRIHCIIEFRDGQFRISDADSMHGTFVGVAKKDCKLYPGQILTDTELLFLGREPFLVKLAVTTDSARGSQPLAEPVVPVSPSESTAAPKTERFRCKNCGEESEIGMQVCEKCGSWGTLESIWI